MDLAPVALQAAELANDLNTLGDRCEHEGTRKEIANIAGETLLLCSTLWRLHEALEANSNEDNYTAAFSQDLDEITSELKLVFDEIGECCQEMQKADAPGGKVPWFFKRGRVARLQKHLEALKTTLVVMRTVLHHGKEYGVQSSPGRLAESTPHTLYEDRAILDSIFAKNRHAIEDLHNAEGSTQDSSLTAPEAIVSDIQPGAYGRNLSTATGIDVPAVSDVLPTPTKPERTNTELQRRFSKRGVRLGVHMSILDMGAHETTTGLRKRWLQAARSAQTSDSSHHQRMTTISEDGTSAALRQAANSSSEDTVSSAHPEAAMSMHGNSTEVKSGRRRGNSLKLIGSPVGSAMSKLIKKLSFSHDISGDGEAAGMSKNDVGFTKMISDRFRKPEITTPEWNQEFENGALGSMKRQF